MGSLGLREDYAHETELLRGRELVAVAELARC